MSDATDPDPVRAALEEALQQPTERREAFLQELQRRDPGLEREVAELLRLERQASDWFDDLGADVARDLGDELVEAVGGPESIGPYRVLRSLGRGGMGAVYLARRAEAEDEDAAPVAVKLARFELATGEPARRFRAERRILARLEHPGIARLVDGGVTPDGRAYTVMEYVDGIPITHFADARVLGVEARLRLFLGVADAVAHAHRNLVLHCDLKPANVLVDAQGAVRLLDFGIGKLLEDDGAGAGLTLTGRRPMTPAYAAPEQVRGDDVSTATDVYGLGVLLYELLAGRRPFADIEDRSALARAITGERPALPSRAVRDTLPARRALLEGDLDTVCLKALSKEPEQRYASAEQLADDVRRHLAGLPVRARPDSFGYRARKFVGRHRVPIALAAGFALAVLGFGIAAARQAARYARERDRAQQAVELLVGVLQTSDPTEGRGATVTAREVLEEAARRIDGRAAGDPEVQAELLELVGRAFWNLGLRERARPLLESARALRGARPAETPSGG